MDLLIQDAWAQGAPAPGGDPLLQLLPLVVIVFVFYFLMIRPQNKRQKEHKEMIAKLAVGDEVVTSGGILGKVTGLGEQFVQVEVADGVRITVQRHTVGAIMPKGTIKNV
jgi:preprotein translocase subunit YajC